MTPQTELEVQGNFFTHPFAELVAEITLARLTGSLRASDKEKKKKWVIYFQTGSIVFAVSNARASRLFQRMLQRGKMTTADVVKVPNYSNDFEFTSYLLAKGFLDKAGIDGLFKEQIEGIIIDACSWEDGDWTFSSLMRVRDGLEFQIDTRKLILDFARCLPRQKVLGRFRSMDEAFIRSPLQFDGESLTAEEEFVLSNFVDQPMTASQIITSSGVSEGTVLHSIYSLWLAGLLLRSSWHNAFSGEQVAAMRGAKLEIKREARIMGVTEVVEPAPELTPVEPVPEPEAIMSVEEYLEQVEQGSTYYDILGVDYTAEYDEIKKGYFFLAKNFHPDRYHSEGGERFKRIQQAFTEIAQAHETLKHADQREMYDYRMRKELAEREKARETGSDEREVMNKDRATENFDTGFSLLMDGDSEQAIPYLARAAHFDPKNARYRAYYGKALAADASQRHKAEAEIQAAVKLDPNNPTFRLVLAEFFVQFNLLKRAEGELTRLLAIFPSNRDALDMLAKLKT
jgi:curved DNA-binding protein CbpA